MSQEKNIEKTMKYSLCAYSYSTTHVHICIEREFKSDLALRRYLNKFLRGYEDSACCHIVRFQDGYAADYLRNSSEIYWYPKLFKMSPHGK